LHHFAIMMYDVSLI